MSGDSYFLDITKTRKDFKDLIGQFQAIQHDNFYVLYTKVIVPSGMNMQKIWPVLAPVSIVDKNNNWFEYTKYKALYDGQSCNIYGYLSGTDLMRDGRALVKPIESAIKWLVLYQYAPEKMPASDTFLDNYPKYLTEGKSLKEFPKFALWYEFLIKLAEEPSSHIEASSLESVSEKKLAELPCMVKTQTLETDVCKASISALDYLLEKAEHRFRQTVLENKQRPIPSDTKQTASGKAKDKNKEPLEIRVAKVIRRNPDLNSIEVAKLAEVGGKNPDGVVRTTKAWKNRKELRYIGKIPEGKQTISDTSGGYSDTSKQSGVEAIVSEPQSEHIDINDMIKEYQLGQRKTYPTPKEIAEKLSTPDDPISEKRAAELLKETENFFSY